MNNWFECKVQSTQMQSDGTNKTVVESYLVQTTSVTEAERKVTEEVGTLQDFEVDSARKVKIAEVFANGAGEKWFRARIFTITIDEKSGEEKKKASIIYVQADTLQKAVKNLEEGMKGTICDWKLSMVTETTVVEVYNTNNN